VADDIAKRIKVRAIDRMGELIEAVPPQPGKRTDKQPSMGAPTRSDVDATMRDWRRVG
jgi:hypothetical protein